MLKRLLVAAVILVGSSQFASAQDLFWSFESESAVTSVNEQLGTSGTAYLFSDRLLPFDAIDLNFTTSDASVILLTDGRSFNEPFPTLGGSAFNSSEVTIEDGGASGNLFAVNVTQNGINPAITEMFNPHFDAGVGPNGAVLLAAVNYDVVGLGDATLDLALGPQGILVFIGLLDPTFGSATLTVDAVPEPSAMLLLMLGSVGLVARRKRR
jgi:hypothetical protein